MAEAEYTTTAKLPIETIWEFVKDVDHWAHFVSGYQSHEKENDNDSIWTLKGDVGVLARVLTFRVHVTEWAGPERVSFELVGLNEPMRGDGEFVMKPYQERAGERATDSSRSTRQKSRLLRFLEAMIRVFLGRGGRARRADTADAEPGPGMTQLTFRLRIDPGGPMAPMVNALMKPVMLPAAEYLANKIVSHLEAAQGAKG